MPTSGKKGTKGQIPITKNPIIAPRTIATKPAIAINRRTRAPTRREIERPTKAEKRSLREALSAKIPESIWRKGEKKVRKIVPNEKKSANPESFSKTSLVKMAQPAEYHHFSMFAVSIMILYHE